MAIDRATAIQHLIEILADFEYADSSGWTQCQELPHHRIRMMTRMKSALARLAPPGSVYLQEAFNSDGYEASDFDRMIGVLQALLADYRGNCLQTFLELAHANLYGDFLTMAESLLSQDALKDPAAVLAGGVLEEHLRNLCDKHGVSSTTTDTGGQIRPKKLDTMNADLAKQGVYGKNEQKQITAWAGIRNSSAHGNFQEFNAPQVELMVQGIRSFFRQFPA